MALSPQEAARLAELEAEFGGASAPNPSANIAQAANGEKPKTAFAEQSQNGAFPRFLRGALRRTMETAGEAPLRFLGNHGVPGAQKIVADYEKHKQATPLGTAGKLGGMAGDIGMAYATGGTGVVAPALAMAAQHQANNYGRTGEVNPGEAALDAGLGIALPAVGNQIGPLLKKWGVGAVRRGLGIPAKMMKGPNPIDIPYALENRIIPVHGGAAKIKENTGEMLGTADNQINDALERLGILFNAPKAAAQARKGISARVEEAGPRGILPHQEEAALPWTEDYVRQAERMAQKEGVYSEPWDGMLPATLGKKLRQTAQGNANYVAGKTPQGLDLASEEFGRAANNQMDEAVDLAAGNDGLKSYRQGDRANADAYRTAREESKKLTPLNKAAAEDEARTKKLGLTADLMMGAFGTGAAFSHPISIIPAAGAIGARNLFFTPGGGRILYEGGRAAGNPLVRKAGRGMIDLGRSAYFGQGDN